MANTAAGPGAGESVKVLDIVEAISVNRTATQLGLNVRHYQLMSSSGTGPTLGDLATALETAIGAQYKAVLNLLATHQGIYVRRVAPLPISAPCWDVSLAGVGLGTGDLAPKQTCGLISWFTARGGRSGRGRTYIPFPGEVNSDANGRPLQAYIDGMSNIAAVWFSLRTIAGPNGGTFWPVLFHKSTLSCTPLTALKVRDKWATQRRRGDFGRENPATAGPIPAGAYVTSREPE